MSKSKRESSTTEAINNLIAELKEDLKEGAQSFKEGAQSVSKESNKLYDRAKEKAADLYESGADAIDDISDSVRGYIKKYQNEQKMRELQELKKQLNTRFGDIIYHEFKKNGTVSKRFLTTDKMSKLIDSITKAEKGINSLGKDLDKK